MTNQMDDAPFTDEGAKRKRFTMIQRGSPPIRREESSEPIPTSPEEDFSPPIPKENAPPPFKKSRGRPQKKYWTHEWTDRATETLIELWCQKEELYNKQHPLFYVKESKDRAVEDIRLSLSEQGFDVTSENILSKFQSLRTYFCTQRTKTLSARRTNGATYMGEDGGECKWRFYKSLMFLDDNMKPRDSHRKMEMINAEYGNSPSFTDRPVRAYDNYPPSYVNAPVGGEVMKPEIENNSYHANIQNNYHNNEHSLDGSFEYSAKRDSCEAQQKHSPKTTKHEDHIFGELVGNMIHTLPESRRKDMVKLEIQQLIIKAKYASNNTQEESS